MTMIVRFVSRPASLAAVAALSVMLMPVPPAEADPLDIPEPWIVPFGIGQKYPDDPIAIVTDQSEVYEFMWQTFVALNWPQLAGGNRAQPDPSEMLAPWGSSADGQSDGPVVWQSYRRPSEVFYKPKQWPIHWNDPPLGPKLLCPPPPPGIEPLIISTYSTNYSDNSDGLNQPYIQANYPTAPVADQNGHYLRYEVGLNQAYFTYIGEFEYYDPRQQVRAVNRYLKYVKIFDEAPDPANPRHRKYFQPLPNGTEPYLLSLPDYARQGIVEWKAAWKRLEGDDVPERFYRRYAYFLNPDNTCTGPFLVGLIAFHIHRVTQFGHIGTTFEQVDNTRLQSEYSSQVVPNASPLPPHASLNPGGEVSPEYPNGYQVCDENGDNCEGGKGGNLPEAIKDGDFLLDNPPISNIVRQVENPDDVQDVNDEWREKLEGTVWFYYQMIGTQNPNVEEPNPDLGPGVRGAQVSNTTNLINTALESYTQKGWSCALCHQNAAPLGVQLPLPPFSEEYDALHTISFLLQNAQNNRGRRH